MSIRKQNLDEPSEFEVIQLHLVEQIKWLIGNIRYEKMDVRLDESRRLLESLPLQTSEYGLACARLKTTLRYCQSAEFGAARYELRLLLSSLINPNTLLEVHVAHGE